MTKVAFPMIGGRHWMGGYNYLLNLLEVLNEHAAGRIAPVLFVGTDLAPELLEPFTRLSNLSVFRHADFDEHLRARRLARALATGRDTLALRHFTAAGIDVVFEWTHFHGWRCPLPAIAWTPDFQHRHLKEFFSPLGYWRRDFAIRAQVRCGRHMMVSSADARRDCETFYPASRGATHVVRFAVKHRAVEEGAARAIADGYGLPERFFFLPNQFWQHKNHECVIRALYILKERGSAPVVAVTGKQADLKTPGHVPRLMRLVEEWQLQREFRTLGLIPFEHVGALMRAADALINPSFFEGWSTTVEEAKSMGVPMLLSSIAVHQEQAQGRAHFFDPGSPAELADRLTEFVPLSSAERRERAQAAAGEAQLRVARFAEDFCALAQAAAGS